MDSRPVRATDISQRATSETHRQIGGWDLRERKNNIFGDGDSSVHVCLCALVCDGVCMHVCTLEVREHVYTLKPRA